MYVGQAGYLETSISKCCYILRNGPEERKFHPYCGGSLKSRTERNVLGHLSSVGRVLVERPRLSASSSFRFVHFCEPISPSHFSLSIYSPSLFQNAIIAKRPSGSRSRAIILNNCPSAVTVLSVISQAPDNCQFRVSLSL